MRINKTEKVPKAMEVIFDYIIKLTDDFCIKHLNEEYKQLARELTAALCRKRPSPLAKGCSNVWACAIIYTLGAVNFLFDKTQKPHMKASDVCEGFGVAKSTASSKSKIVQKAFNMTQLDMNWCLPSKLETHLLPWLLEINGYSVDARYASTEIQQMAYDKGFIPYIPIKK
jgi:Domain of unknown function (DUF6398)